VAEKYNVVGKRCPKPDALEKATGRIIYGHDLRLPRMLEGKILRSPHAHARIAHIDAARAARLPGVKAVLTGESMEQGTFGFGGDNIPLKKGKVRRIGDEVAAVAAVDRDTALEAVSLIQVEYEPLAPLFDARRSLDDGAPLIHEERESNLFRDENYVHGDPDAALARANVVVEDAFELPYVMPGSMETCFCLADVGASGNLTLHSTTQIPYLLQNDMSKTLGIPGSRIRVIQTAIGGSFGRGLDIYPFEPIAALLSREAGRPVRIAFTREEEMANSPLRQPLLAECRSGAMRDGTLLVRDFRGLLDIGAYASWGAVTTLVMMEAIGSLYRPPNARFLAKSVYTNNPVTGAMRGFGNPQATHVLEIQMDRLAEEIGMDPLEFRIRNANRPDEELPQGLKITSCGMKECLERAGQRIGWKGRGEAQSRYEKQKGTAPHIRRGVGFAATLNVGGGARIYRSDGCGAIVKVDDFGHVTLLTGASELGQGSDAVLVQMVAEELGVEPGDVTLINNDTALAPWDVGAHASRTTFIAGNAALIAAREAGRQILETAAEKAGVPAEDLVMRGGQVFRRGEEEPLMPVAKAVRSRHFRRDGDAVVAHGWYDPPNEMLNRELKGNISAAYGFGAQAAEVEVDVETGKVRVLRIAAAHDVGRAINPMYVEGQIHGGIQMGLGYALTEEIRVEEGRGVNQGFHDYRLFTAMDMPEIDVAIVETIDPEGPFGAKGVGEMGTTPVAPAVANAVHDAIGVRLHVLPLTPDKVVRALAGEPEELRRLDGEGD